MSVIIERRLSLRLLAYWEKKRGLRAMPQLPDINAAEELHDYWQDCFLLRITDASSGAYEFIHRGSVIEEHWPDLETLQVSLATLLAKATPLIEEGELAKGQREMLKYRQCLLPLGDEHGIAAVLGGVRFKIFAR